MVPRRMGLMMTSENASGHPGIWGVSWGYRIPGYRGILRISVSEDTVGILGIPRNPQDTIGVLRIRGILGYAKYVLRIPSVSWDTKGILGIRYPQDTRGVLGYQVSPGYPRVSWVRSPVG